MTSLDAQKQAFRHAAMTVCQALDPVAAGEALSKHAIKSKLLPTAGVIAGFWPIRQEIDIRSLLHALYHRGNQVALPVTGQRGEQLSFRIWRPSETLLPERFGTMRPEGEIVVPDTLLIPLLAFDAAGGRLGYGGGFYDRTLAALPGCPRLGCAFAAQQVDAVPVGPYDVPMDAVATENGIIRCGGQFEDTISG